MGENFFPEMIGVASDPSSGAEQLLGGDQKMYETKANYWLEAAYEEAKSELAGSEEISKVSKYIDYISGRQWGGKRPSYRASPIDNRIWRLIWELISIMTDIRPIFEIRATKKEYEQQASMLNKVTKSWWLNSDADMNLGMIIMYAILTTGYGKLTWNHELRNGEGDIELMPISPSDLLPLKPRSTLQSSQAVIYRTLMPLGWFREKFGSRGALVMPDMDYSRYSSPVGRPPQISQMVFDQLSPQMKRVVGVSDTAQSSAYPTAMYREFWIKDYCVVPSTRVLTTALEWKRADSLKEGDELIGCDENGKVSKKNRCRWLRRTKIERIKQLRQPCTKITTDKGVVTSSTRHRWLARKGNGLYTWKYAEDLIVGDEIAFFSKPWEEEASKDAGYLSGLFDGEGWTGRYSLGFAQSSRGDNQTVLQKGIRLLEDRKYKLYINSSRKGGVVQVVVNGGREERLRFLGTIRPPRLLAKSSNIWEGKQLQGRDAQAAKIISTESIGEQEVIAIQTNEKTFIAEGFVSHNSYNLSNKTVLMGRPKSNWAYEVLPGQRLYPRGRLIAKGGKIILYDGPNPYWHGNFPFACLRMNIVPWQWAGLSDIAPLIPLQDIINNILGGVLDMVKKAVNPVFMGPKNALSEANWDSIDWSMPGARVGYNQNISQKPEWGPTPQLPSFVMQILQMVAREMDQSSGLAAVSEAMKKKQVPSGETLERLKEAQQTPLRLKGRNIEVFLRDLGSQNIWNIFQFYTAKRRMCMLGTEGLTFEDFDYDPGTAIPAGVKPEDHAKSFTFMIQPGSLLNADKQDRLMIYRLLRMSGDLDRETFFKALDIPGLNVKTVEAGLKREMLEGVPMHPPKTGKAGAK